MADLIKINQNKSSLICLLCKETTELSQNKNLSHEHEENKFFDILIQIFPSYKREFDLFLSLKNSSWWCGKCSIVMNILKDTFNKIKILEKQLTQIKCEIEPLLFLNCEKLIKNDKKEPENEIKPSSSSEVIMSDQDDDDDEVDQENEPKIESADSEKDDQNCIDIKIEPISTNFISEVDDDDDYMICDDYSCDDQDPLSNTPQPQNHENQNLEKTKASKTPRKYKCFIKECSDKFESDKLLLEHINTIHPEPEEPKTYNCPHQPCSAAFKKWFYLEKHILRNHRTKFNCDICDKTFTNESTLSFHQSAIHKMGEVMSNCNVSGENILKVPLNIPKVLLDNSKLKCDICISEIPDISFSSESALSFHKAVMHNKGERVKCEKCEVVVLKELLEKHQNTQCKSISLNNSQSQEDKEAETQNQEPEPDSDFQIEISEIKEEKELKINEEFDDDNDNCSDIKIEPITTEFYMSDEEEEEVDDDDDDEFDNFSDGSIDEEGSMDQDPLSNASFPDSPSENSPGDLISPENTGDSQSEERCYELKITEPSTSSASKNKDKEDLTCLLCSKSFSSKQKLSKHQHHHIYKECPICGKEIKKLVIKKHLKEHEENPEKVALDLPSKNKVKYPVTFKCIIKDCELRFESVKLMMGHVRTIHPDAKNICPFPPCSAAYFAKWKLKHHISAKHMERYKCGICNKAFSSNSNLVCHNQTVICKTPQIKIIKVEPQKKIPEKVEKPRELRYACFLNDCFLKFETEKLRLEHVRKIHPQKCPYHPCTATFSYLEREKLEIHILLSHNPKLKCDICSDNRSFSSESALSFHKAVMHNLGERVKCEKCEVVVLKELLEKHKYNQCKQSKSLESESQRQLLSFLKK